MVEEVIELEEINDITLDGYSDRIQEMRIEIRDMYSKSKNILYGSSRSKLSQKEFSAIIDIIDSLKSADANLEESYFNMKHRWAKDK